MLSRCSICHKHGTIRDDESGLKFCWEHRRGLRHQKCGCVYSLRDFRAVKSCTKHARMRRNIGFKEAV